MKAIWKYILTEKTEQVVLIPQSGKILSVQRQNDNICMWVMVSPQAKKEVRKFVIQGTGHPLNDCITSPPAEDPKYLGTCVMEVFVWHVFEIFS